MTGVFGRDREMALLRAALVEAVAGRGRLVLLSGEPGIGKSTLVASLADEAAAGNILVTAARAPETSGAPAYWLWTQVLRSVLGGPARRTPPNTRATLARILPELRPRHSVTPAEQSESEGERFRLADDIATLLLDSARDGWRLLILDDLHAADASSLEVLGHLAGRLGSGPLLVVGVHRDTAGALTAALEGLLGRVSHEADTLRIPLTGLDRPAVQQQLTSIVGHTVDAGLAGRVHQRTGGNPFFTAEVARLLAQEPDSEGRVPPRVRDVIGWRLGHLPAETRDVLDRAALIGGEVPVDVLAAACSRSPESVLATLEAAVAAGFIREGSSLGHVRFAHTLVAEAIADALSLGRTAGLHREVAAAIETRRADNLDDWLPALARHWAAATPDENAAARALQTARLAAEQAEARLAFDDATRLWRLAVEAAGRAGPGADVQAELQVGLTRSLFRSGDVGAAIEACAAAARLAEAAGRPDLVAAAALVVEGVSEPQWAPALIELAERALAGLGQGEAAMSARLHAKIGVLEHLTPAASEERERTEVARALGLAERSGDLGALQAALRAWQLVHGGPEGVEERLRNAERMMRIGTESGDPWPELWGRLWSVDALVQLGRLGEAELALRDLGPLLERLRWPVARWHQLRTRAAILQAQGRFGEALDTAEKALAQISGTGLGRAQATHMTFLESQADLIGDLPGRDERLDWLRELVTREPVATVRLVLSLLREGFADEARALYARLPPLSTWNPPRYLLSVQLMARLRCALGLGEREDVEPLLARLERFARWHVAFGAGVHVTYGSGFLYTGMAAAYLGDLERAVADLTRAVEENIRAGATAFSVVARLELAEVLERRRSGAELEDARRSASMVVQEAQRLGMRPYVVRAAALLSGMPRRRVRAEELTTRELEVARLIAEGLTNRQLAARLGISERTAENHVDHILGKLGFAGRAQVAAWVASGKAS